jgi:hypothetical protein
MAAETGYGRRPGRQTPRILALAVVFAVLGCPASANDNRIVAFFGSFVGTARVEGSSDRQRDIIVSIEPARKGFSIYTSTVIANGPDRSTPGVKWRTETQNFVVTDKEHHLYEPLLRKSMFARRRDPDLLAGDTLAWANVRGRTLGVYAMDVLEDGHYELRVFERTLTPRGMDLKFTRYIDGQVVRRLVGTLARVAEQ